MIYLQSRMSKKKAITYDGFNDKWFSETDRRDLLSILWNRSVLSLPKLGEARLIALNKCWPNIPNANQFRPIIVLSPLFKFLEHRWGWMLEWSKDAGVEQGCWRRRCRGVQIPPPALYFNPTQCDHDPTLPPPVRIPALANFNENNFMFYMYSQKHINLLLSS